MARRKIQKIKIPYTNWESNSRLKDFDTTNLPDVPLERQGEVAEVEEGEG